MCETGPHFKLCTCSEALPSSNYWILTRGNEGVHNNVVGEIMRPPDLDEAVRFDAAYFILKRLKFDLNNTNGGVRQNGSSIRGLGSEGSMRR